MTGLKKYYASGETAPGKIPARSLRVGIIGGAGYTGGELIRLLINHPQVNISFINSRSNAGKPVSDIHQDLLGDTDLKFSGEITNDIDVLFLCLGHGESKKFLTENNINPNNELRISEWF